MPKYRITVRLTGRIADTHTAARSEIEEELKKSGLTGWQVVSVDHEGKAPASRSMPRSLAESATWRRQTNAGGLLLVAAAAWAVWFFWFMLGDVIGG